MLIDRESLITRYHCYVCATDYQSLRVEDFLDVKRMPGRRGTRHHKDDEILQIFALALRRAREKKNLTQETAASEVGIDRAAWSFMENSRRNISLVTASRAARALGMSLGELLTRTKK